MYDDAERSSSLPRDADTDAEAYRDTAPAGERQHGHGDATDRSKTDADTSAVYTYSGSHKTAAGKPSSFYCRRCSLPAVG